MTEPENNAVTMETRRFLTASVNLLHAAFIKAPRAQAKRHFARVQGGGTLDLAMLKLEGRGEVQFRVALDHSEFNGRFGFTVFRKMLQQLLARLAERVRMRVDVPVYSAEQTGDLLFNVSAPLTEDGKTNVLLLGVDKPAGGFATLRLQYLNPEQFRKPTDARSPAP
jgi:hypothetical protein